MTSFNNVALFIKRAEEYQTKEFIIEAFASSNIGKVRDVKFIKKQGDFGKNYNGAIVIFEHWNMNNIVRRIFNEMSEARDGTTKFYFNIQRYWIIKIHSQTLPECEELIVVDSSLSDKDKITKLEQLVKSMSAQIHYMQTKQEKNERHLMDCEHKQTYHSLVNTELQSQLDEKDWERELIEDELKEEMEKLREENLQMRCRLAIQSIEITRKDNECNTLRQEVSDQNSIISYMLLC